MNKTRFASVWDAIENTPAEAENMRLRSELMMSLKKYIVDSGMNQSQAAKLFNITQPRVSDLMRGKINVFALESLVNMAAFAGLSVEISIKKAA